jgi:hypothetical protein
MDANGDGQGEFGFFGQLTGTQPCLHPTAGRQLMSPPVLGQSFAAVVAGRVHRAGYVFEVWLPAVDGGWLNEQDAAHGRRVDPVAAAKEWICYAWPEEYDVTGRRTFFMNHSGDILASSARLLRPYSGDVAPQPGRSAFVRSGAGGVTAANTIDGFGDRWGVG